MTTKQDSTIAHAAQIVASALAAASDKEAILRLAAGFGVWLEAMKADVDRALQQMRIVEAYTIGDLTLDEARAEIAGIEMRTLTLSQATNGAFALAHEAIVEGRLGHKWREDTLYYLEQAIQGAPDMLEVSGDEEKALLLEMFAALMNPGTLTQAPIPADPTAEAAE